MPLKIAVIGAGPAGLTTAKAWLKAAPESIVDVFEKGPDLGGVWQYQPASSTHPMYSHLRTNLPKEIMCYRALPWGNKSSTATERSFATHSGVLEYLDRYTKEFQIDKHIKFNEEVTSISLAPQNKLTVTTPLSSGVYDHVCVATGHFSNPSFPSFVSSGPKFAGTTMHSIQYDAPSDPIFANANILCVGGRASGGDLARELKAFARNVWVADNGTGDWGKNDDDSAEAGNVKVCNRMSGISEDGTKVLLEGGGELEDIDIIIYCTGYDYSYPFFKDGSIPLKLLGNDRRVTPLHKQLWHALFPQCSFVGLQQIIVPLPFFEFQARAVVHQALNGFEGLTSAESGGIAVDEDIEGRSQDAHIMGDKQWAYCEEMARLGGDDVEKAEQYLRISKDIYDASGLERKACPIGGDDSYRETDFWRHGEEWGVCTTKNRASIK
jgi:thioredoxin reductase